MCKLLGDKCFSAKKRKTNKKRRIATDDNSPFRWYFFSRNPFSPVWPKCWRKWSCGFVNDYFLSAAILSSSVLIFD